MIIVFFCNALLYAALPGVMVQWRPFEGFHWLLALISVALFILALADKGSSRIWLPAVLIFGIALAGDFLAGGQEITPILICRAVGLVLAFLSALPKEVSDGLIDDDFI